MCALSARIKTILINGYVFNILCTLFTRNVRCIV